MFTEKYVHRRSLGISQTILSLWIVLPECEKSSEKEHPNEQILSHEATLSCSMNGSKIDAKKKEKHEV